MQTPDREKYQTGQVLNQDLLAVRQACSSSEPPWITRFDHSYHNLSSNARERVSVWRLDGTLGLYVSASRHLCRNAVAQAAFMLTDCFVFQLIVCCDTGNNRKVFGEQSTLIWRLCNLYLCQICGLWSEIDAYFMLWLVTIMSNGSVIYSSSIYKYV